MSQKIITVSISIVAATAGIASYIYFRRKKEAKKKNLPVSFV